jgi:integrase
VSNVGTQQEIFNKDVKDRYLSSIPKSQVSSALRLFKVSYLFEMDHGKDLYDLGRKDVRYLLFYLKPSTLKSSGQNITLIRGYIDWAIEEGLYTGLNLLDTVGADWKDQFVRNTLNYFSTSDLDFLINSRKNYQDKAILSLLRTGVSGERFSEIVNLRRSDIHGNTLSLYGLFKSRQLEVSHACIEHCLMACDESSYEKVNGKSLAKSGTTALVENDRVIKSSITKTINFTTASKYIVYRRIESIAEEISRSDLNVDLLRFSGIVEFVMKPEFLELGGLEPILDRFSILDSVSRKDIKNKLLKVPELAGVDF